MVAVHEVGRERGGGPHLKREGGKRGEKETREEEGRGMWIQQRGGGPHLLDHDAFGEAVVEQVAPELDVRGRRRPHAGVRVVVHL